MTLIRLVLLMALIATGARAHLTHDQTRVFVAAADGRTVYVRTPLPFAFAEEIAAAAQRGAPLDTPHLRLERTGAGPRYRVAAASLEGAAFRARLGALFAFERGGRAVAAEVTALRLHLRAPRAPFGSIRAARASLAGPGASLDPVFAEAVLDVRYDLGRGTGPLGVRALGPPLDLPPGTQVTNRLVVEGGAATAAVTVPGQLSAPARFPPLGAFAAAQPLLPWLAAVLLGAAAALGLHLRARGARGR